MFTSPVTFREAEQQLSERLDTPTAMKYTDITLAWDAEARQHAFFSARVAEASILSELHGKTQAVLDGRMTTDQARRLLRNYFVGDGADALARLGFAPPRDAHGVAELSSIARINLILETNIRIAQETAHYRRWAELKAAYPYGIWRCGTCENHREQHLARDGKVYAFDHPIWTQSPPGGEFNCHCTRELCSQRDLERMGLSPEPMDSEFEKSSLGFDPSRGMQPPPPSDRTPMGIVDALANALDREAQEPGSPANPDTPPNITPGTGVDRPSLVGRLREKLRRFRQMLAGLGKGRQEQYLAGTGAAGKTNASEEIGEHQSSTLGIPTQGELKKGASRGMETQPLHESIEEKARRVLKATENALIHGRLKLKNPKGFPIIRHPSTVEVECAKTNPKIGLAIHDQGYSVNCQRCVFAFEARMRGLDVQAQTCPNFQDPLARDKGWLNVCKNAETVPTPELAVLRAQMRQWGDGARAVVHVKKTNFAYGHVFVAIQLNGETFFLDPQDVTRNAADNFDGVDKDKTTLTRIDNLQFDDSLIRKCCKPAERSTSGSYYNDTSGSL